VHGLTLRTSTPAHWARAAVEGLLCGLADGIDAVVAQGVAVERVLLIGGGAGWAAVQEPAPAIFGRPVVVPAPGSTWPTARRARRPGSSRVRPRPPTGRSPACAPSRRHLHPACGSGTRTCGRTDGQ
jgi:hypothetical protein